MLTGDGLAEDIPDEYLVEIGRVNTRWAVLEGVVDLCLIKLAGKEVKEGRSLIIFNHMAFPMKLDVMGALVSELLPSYPLLSGFPAVRDLLKQAQEKRNSIVHGRFGIDDGVVEVSHLTARGKLKFSTTSISVVDIRAIADLIIKAAHVLYALIVIAENIPPHIGQ